MNTGEYESNFAFLKQFKKDNFMECDYGHLYKSFKYFRDLSTKSQPFRNELCKELLELTVGIVNCLFTNYDDKFLPSLKQGLQFIYNLTVGDSSNHLCIWEKCSGSFLKWMEFDNEQTRNYTCGILYNITLEHDELSLDIINNTSLLCIIINSAIKGTDFPLLFIDNLWKLLGSDDVQILMNSLYKCNSTTLVPILNMLYDFIKEYNCEICLNFASCIVNKYKTLLNSVESQPNFDTLQEVYIFLKIIVLLSGTEPLNRFLQRDTELLETTKRFLEIIHFEGKNPNSIFSPTENMFTERTSVENLKANLIRLIGNLCWRNKAMQDKIRDCNGLPLILDCCIRDGKNPFITEIVVFAIRNLCEGNIENQNFVRDMNEETHNEMSERTQNWPSVFVPS